MVKTLIKKQLMEVFKGYFYDSKKNKKRSSGGIIAYFILFGVLMIGVLGGMFGALAVSLCGPLSDAGMGWLYFIIMGSLSIVLGAFGGVFNSYSGLYLGKDNDLLLSMPIPVRYIMASRLINVYILGAMYSIVAILPAEIVYWVVVGPTISNMVCGIILIFVITLIVMVLSCILGWGVAKISLKLKRKSFAVVVSSIAFIGIYYFFYFKASALIRDLIANAGVYGDKVKAGAYWLFFLGKAGEGDWLSALICLAFALAVFAITWYVIAKTFLSMVTTSGKSARTEYREKSVKEKSAFRAVLGKELSRFLSSSTYMLNSGLGIVFVVVSGVLLLFKGEVFFSTINSAFEQMPGAASILIAAALCLLACMNNISAPSVSLEGKNIWILQSLPVRPATVLRAKAVLHLLLSGVPMVFAVICIMIVLPETVIVRLMLLAFVLVFICFSVMFASFLGIKLPNLSWTSEVVPLKQGGAAMFSIFGGWVIVAAFAGLYLLIGYKIGPSIYLAISTLVFAAAAIILRRVLYTKGAQAFAEL